MNSNLLPYTIDHNFKIVTKTCDKKVRMTMVSAVRMIDT